MIIGVSVGASGGSKKTDYAVKAKDSIDYLHDHSELRAWRTK